MAATKTATTMTARAAARALGVSPPTVLHMLEAGELPGKLVDGRWRIPAAAVRAVQDALLDRHSALAQSVVPSASAVEWLQSQIVHMQIDVLAAEIVTAKALVSAWTETRAVRERGAAVEVLRERLETLEGAVREHHAAVAAVEDVRRLRDWVTALGQTAVESVREFDSVHPQVRAILKARRDETKEND